MTTSTIHRSAWEQTTSRQRALQTLTTTIANDPSELQDAVRRARSEEFGPLDSLLHEAHALWMRTFDARLDAVLEHGGYGDQAATDALWTEVGRALPGLATLLDAYATHPTVVQAHALHARRMRRTVDVALPSGWEPPAPVRRSRRRPACSGLRRARALLVAH
ncbi:hypothetical protein FE697_001960 [Mumia zhuanghuii]|uniref:Uncharacterized protein n=2 Tax=Mumia TaxID=1546255 RepID=A0ABW1QJB6_9ACTN|nr:MULTISPECIES: hypothetical protein [Mumia]KAA1424710.1 hypothetical protein FE697_001960 [Mumia zhuanghuii]